MSQDLLDRALGYPYPLPNASFVIDKGEVFPLHADDAPRRREGRTPVLAVGSNQSPQQIARKFPDPSWSEIPCERCVIHDFDTVFSAHITAYGSVPAALHPCPGTSVTLYVNWLDDAQLGHMHKTELGHANYVYARLNGIRLATELGLEMDSVQFYRSNAGAYAPNGTPVPLAEVTAQNRRWTGMTQRDVQADVHQRTAADHEFEAYILSSIEDATMRRQRINAISQGAHPFDHADMEILLS